MTDASKPKEAGGGWTLERMERLARDDRDLRQSLERIRDQEAAAVEGAVAACRGLPLHTVADSGHRARSGQGDAWERGWAQAANLCGTDLSAVSAGRSDGLSKQWRCRVCGGLVEFDGTAPDAAS